MDFTGTLVSGLTIPMTLLNAGCGIAGLWLVMRGDWSAVLIGALLFIGSAIIAPLLSRMSKGLAELAVAEVAGGRRERGHLAAILCGVTPIVVIILWEIASLRLLQRPGADGNGIAIWIWSFGVATGAWSWQAHRANNQDRTLKGLQAYAAQLAYVILSICMLLLGWPLPVAIALMLVPLMFPLVVGMLLAIADRDALRDVQV